MMLLVTSACVLQGLRPQSTSTSWQNRWRLQASRPTCSGAASWRASPSGWLPWPIACSLRSTLLYPALPAVCSQVARSRLSWPRAAGVQRSPVLATAGCVRTKVRVRSTH